MTERRGGPAGGAGGAREAILARVRSALEGRPGAPHPGFPPLVGASAGMPSEKADGTDDGGREILQRFADSFTRSGGELVHLSSASEARSWLEGFQTAFRSAAVGAAVPTELRPSLPPAPPEDADLGVSLGWAGAAASGSLVLSSGEGRGLQLLPPAHLVWVDARDICVELGEALERARARGPLPPVLALHSGPSKSADIGRILVTGVHGPGRIIAAVMDFPLG